MLYQGAPERCLPVLGFIEPVDQFPRFPARQPLRAVDQILIVKIRNARAELEEFALIIVVIQIVTQHGERVVLQHPGQQRH